MNIILVTLAFPGSSTVSVVAFVTLAIISTMMHGFVFETWCCCRYVYIHMIFMVDLFLCRSLYDYMSMCLCVQACMYMCVYGSNKRFWSRMDMP